MWSGSQVIKNMELEKKGGLTFLLSGFRKYLFWNILLLKSKPLNEYSKRNLIIQLQFSTCTVIHVRDAYIGQVICH